MQYFVILDLVELFYEKVWNDYELFEAKDVQGGSKCAAC